MNEDQKEQQIHYLYETYSDKMFRFILMMAGDSQHAEDLTQETFIRAYQGFDNFEGRAKYQTWLYTIARNVTHDFFRKKRAISFIPSFFQDQPAVVDRTPEEIAELEDETVELYRALSSLKTSYKEVIILRYIKEFSTKETSEILRCSESKVKSTMHRAMPALRKELENLRGDVIEITR